MQKSFSQRCFTVRDILRHEAEALSHHGPSRGEPKEPESNLDPFTRLRDFGAGVCRVQRWPDDEDPYGWGCRNESLLLDEPIHSPARWEVEEEYRSRFKHLIVPIDHTYLDGGFRTSDEGYEERLLAVLNDILLRVTTVAFILLIQLWRRDSEHRSHPDYHVAFEALHQFSVQQIRTSQRMSSRSRAVAIVVPRSSYLQSRDNYEDRNCLVSGIALRTGFAEKVHAANERGCRTIDEVLSSILDDEADQDTNYLFTKFGLRNDWQSFPVGHIVQMSHIVSLSASQMGVSTSIWGYLRFFIQLETNDGYAPILYITRNMGINTAWNDSSRTNDSSNFNLVCHIYYFVMLALLKTHGPRILPPDLRENECLLNFFSSPAMTKRSRRFNLSSCCFLPRLALRWISFFICDIWFSLLATLWGLVLHYCGSRAMESVGYLRIPLIEGSLQRITEDEQISGRNTLYLRFDSWDVRDATEVGISRRAGLALKVFHNHQMFEAELRAYSVLQKARVKFIPQLFGIFNVPGTKGAMLFTMVGKHIEELASLQDRRHVDELMRNIHTANIHHHDLRLDNIVRGTDGALRIIDFGHSSPADECEAAELCPDQIFLNLWVR